MIITKDNTNRFQFVQLLIRRTNQLIHGEAISKGLKSEFTARRQGEIPNHRFPKVAMEEFKEGKFTWKRIDPKNKKISEDNSIVFGE